MDCNAARKCMEGCGAHSSSCSMMHRPFSNGRYNFTVLSGLRIPPFRLDLIFRVLSMSQQALPAVVQVQSHVVVSFHHCILVRLEAPRRSVKRLVARHCTTARRPGTLHQLRVSELQQQQQPRPAAVRGMHQRQAHILWQCCLHWLSHIYLGRMDC